MIDYIRGVVVGLEGDSNKSRDIILETQGGIGYRVTMSLRAASGAMKEAPGLPVKVLMHHVSENDGKNERLYGFGDSGERDTFHRLCTVKGVGSMTALCILSTCDWEQVLGFILNGDHLAFEAINGIGPKAAKRIIEALNPAGVRA